MTDRYAVIGNPIAHSKSPRIHALFAAQTAQDMTYQALLAPLDRFADVAAGFFAGGGRGANVTVPFKEQAMRLATRLTPRACAAGAVNTLAVAADGIVGDNTDGAGLVRDLVHRVGVPLAGKRVLLLGAGGAARGVLRPLLDERPQALVLANRTAEKARAIVAAMARPSDAEGHGEAAAAPRACGLTELPAEPPFDVVINATAAGLSDSEIALPRGLFAPGALAYEMLYGRQTPFMRFARRDGAALVADGLGMLVEQAAESFVLWRGVRPDTDPVLDALRRERAQ